MTNSIYNESIPHHPSRSTSSTSNNDIGLISNTGRKRLHSFLDTLSAPEEFYSTTDIHTQQTTTASKVRNRPYASVTSSPPSPAPTPVLLSPPYSRNITFDQQQQQHPIHRKRSNLKGMRDDIGVSATDNKYRVLLEDPSTPLMDYYSHPRPPPPSSPTYIKEENMTMDQSAATPSDTKDATPPSPSPATKPKGSGRGRKPVHELLSDDQKKANHIASEQKRRANIRIGFDQLVDIVPNLNECQRSESLILQKSADYIRQLVDTKNGLRDRVRELQTVLGEVPDEDSSEGEMDYGF
ncbi:hypothetical protein BCR42DRAFT_402053 [Absidia repens]|uniref:BHLH domain-containing protein n=1 Tax=Absidia repens TaxID=90262 RepID=A0A1X2IZ83_9FUNG|nr:hypothetical protein BCR42DRAFT_402053 [Absidia repens]